jgi:2-oxoglutarate dehydrogenase E1 component
MTVAQPSTPASHFHLLRQQALVEPARPLVVFTPKSMLRLKAAASSPDDFTSGRFQPVLADKNGPDPAGVTRVLLCSGKVTYDLLATRAKLERTDVAVLRLEQLYPLVDDAIRDALAPYTSATEVVWVQDEPANQGPWQFIALNLPEHLGGLPLRRVSRVASASPAAGSAKVHELEQAALLEAAFAG